MKSPAQEMVDAITPEIIVAALRAFPSNGKPPADDKLYLVWLHMEAVGLIESRAQETPCRTCGTPRVTHSYHRITPAGRILLEFAGGILCHCGEPAITNLDGDDFCIRHANEWVHGEGQAAHESELRNAGKHYGDIIE